MKRLIPNPDIDLWNSDPKIHFWANFGRKSQSCLFFWKIDTNGISRILILNQTSVFWISQQKSIFGQIWSKSQSCQFCLKIGKHGISRVLILISTSVFWIFNQKTIFGHGLKKPKLSVLPDDWHTWYLEDADSYFNISFLNLKT